MKDEIKEKIKAYYVANDIDEILDYITNLQDKVEWYENIEVNKTIDKFRLEHNKEIKRLNEENERLKKALCKDNIVPKCKYDYLKRQKEGLELDLSCIKDYKSKCEKLELENKVLKEQMVAMVQPNYVYGIELQGVGKDEKEKE